MDLLFYWSFVVKRNLRALARLARWPRWSLQRVECGVCLEPTRVWRSELMCVDCAIDWASLLGHRGLLREVKEAARLSLDLGPAESPPPPGKCYTACGHDNCPRGRVLICLECLLGRRRME